VTDKLLTGYDAPVLYALYLDKPMRDHVLLQAIARVNRPYADERGVSKRVGMIVDFVGVLRDLKKALTFDSSVVEGALEDVAVLMADLRTKIGAAASEYLAVDSGEGADAQLEGLVYGRFLDPDSRKTFFDAYKEIEALWEILSPSAELREHIRTYKRLSQLYAAVRNAYAETSGFISDLAYKTQRLIQESARQEDLSRFSKSVTFDSESLKALRDEEGPDEGKVYDLVRGLREEIEQNPATAVVLDSLRQRAERVLQGLEERRVSGLAAMSELELLAAEKDQAQREAAESGLTEPGFAIYWSLRGDPALAGGGISALDLAADVEALLAQFPNWEENSDEQRRLRLSLYKPLLGLAADDRARIVETTMQVLDQVAR
jgi:type I restriction enzyme, R subunit